MKKCLSLILSVLLMLSCCTLALAEEDVIELQIEMTVTVEEDMICADLVDSQGGTVSTWPVSLEIDGVQVDTTNTDEYGTATFRYAIPSDTQEIACVAKDGQFENYRFIGCTVYVEYDAPEEVTEPEETETEDETASTESTDAPTEDEQETTATPATTTKVVVATTTTTEKQPANTTPMTTTISGDRVAIGVNADNAFLIASGSTQTEFQSGARMWMDNAVYRSLVQSSAATLQLQLTLNEQAGEMSRLVAAKNANATYATYADEEVKGFAMDLTVAYVDEYTNVPLDIEDGTYIVEIPVPTKLRSCEKLAVAVCTAEGLAQLIEVKPTSGMLNFTIQRFQTLAIVGFGNSSMSLGSISNTPWLLVLAIVLGILLVAGGIALLVFVAFRKKPATACEEKTEEAATVSFETEDDDVDESADGDDDVVVAAVKEEISVPVVSEPKSSDAVAAPASDMPVTSASVSTTSSEDELDELLNDVLSDLDSI